MSKKIEIYDLADLALVWNAVYDTATKAESFTDRDGVGLINRRLKVLLKDRDDGLRKSFGHEDTTTVNYRKFVSGVNDFLYGLDEVTGQRRGSALLWFHNYLKKDVRDRL